MNGHAGQLKGPFDKEKELLDIIRKQCIPTMTHISHLGIQVEPKLSFPVVDNEKIIVYINGQEIEIGTTGIYEVRNTEITSIIFKQDMDESTLLDYVIRG